MNIHISLINQFLQILAYQPFTIILFIIVGNIINCLPLIFIHDQQTLKLFGGFQKYLNIMQMSNLDSLLKLGIYFLAILYPIIIILLYIFSYFYYKIHLINNQLIAQIWCFLLKIFEYIAFYPIMQILSFTIGNSFFNAKTSDFIIFNDKFIETIISGISFIIFFLSIFIQYAIIQILGQTISQDRQTNSHFLKEQKQYNLVVQVIQSLILELYTKDNNYYNITIYLTCINQLVYYFIAVYQTSSYRIPTISHINQICINAMLSLSLAFLIEILNTFALDTNFGQKLNFDFVWIFFLLSYISFNIQKQQKIKYLYENPKNLRQLLKKVEAFETVLTEKNKQYNQIQIIGIIKQHLSQNCQRKTISRCFCTLKVIHDAKKQKDIRKLLTSITKHIKIFSKFIIKSWFEDHLYINERDYEAKIQYSKFNYYSLHQTIQAFLQMQQVQNIRNLHFLQKIEVQCFSKILLDEINNKSVHSYLEKLDFENVIQIEEQIKQIEILIAQILEKQIKIFKSILKASKIDENEVIIGNIQLQTQIKQIQLKWKKITSKSVQTQQGKVQVQSYLNKRKSFSFLDHWFHINILKVRKRQPDVTIFDDEYIQEQSASESDNENVYNSMKPFNLLSGIIHSDLQGNVKKMSQFCTTLFGNSRIDQISQLMPICMRRNHEFYMNMFKQNEKRLTLFKRTKIFYLNEKQNLILANKYLKIFLGFNFKIEYICMIRPIIKMTPSNFILLNEDWEIDAVTANLEQFFEKKICFLLSCPKLLQFSQFNQFVKEEDMDFFDFKLNQQMTQTIEKGGDASNSRQFFRRGDQHFRHLLDQAQMDEQYSQDIINKIKFHKIVNEDNIVLFARFPFQSKDMQDEYQKLKQRILDGNTKILKKLREVKHANLLNRNKTGQLRFNRFELLKRIYFYRLLQQKQIYQGLKKLFKKFCQDLTELQKIMRLEGRIEFDTKTSINKNILIQVNRFEIFEQEKQKKKQTNSTSSERKRTVLSTSSNFIIRRNSDIFLANFFTNNSTNLQSLASDNDSVRENLTKTLITENELNSDFQNMTQLNQINALQFQKQNIFIKDEQNQMLKKLPGLKIIGIANKVLFLFLIIFYFSELTFGAQLNLKTQLKDYFIKVQIITNFTQILCQTYNSIIDIDIQKKGLQNQIYDQLDNQTFLNNTNNFLEILNSNPSMLNQIFSEISDKNNNQSFLDDIQLFRVNLNLLLQEQSIQSLQQPSFELDSLIDYFRKKLIPVFYDCQNTALLSQHILQDNDINWIVNFFKACFTFIIILISGIIVLNLQFIFKAVNIFRLTVVSFQNFNKTQFKYIHNFFIFLKQQLKSLNGGTINNSFQLESIMNRDDSNDCQTKKQITLIQSKFWRKLKFKLTILYLSVIGALSLMAIEFYLNFNQELLNAIDQIDKYTQVSNLMLYWALPIIKDQFLYVQNLQNVTSSTQYIQIIKEFQSAQFNRSFYSSSFDSVILLYYGNICDNQNEQMTLIEQNCCQQLLNGALSKGLVQYYELLAQGSLNLIDLNDLRFEKLSIPKLLEFSYLQPLVFSIQQLAMIDVENYLTQQFNQKILQEQILLITFLAISFILYVLLIELYFHKLIETYYNQFRQLFHHFYPNELMIQNKLVRAQFIRYGILKK